MQASFIFITGHQDSRPWKPKIDWYNTVPAQAEKLGKPGVQNVSFPMSQKEVKLHQLTFTISNYNSGLLSRCNAHHSSHCILQGFHERLSKTSFSFHEKKAESFKLAIHI